MAKCKALTGSAVKGLNAKSVIHCETWENGNTAMQRRI